MLHRRTMLAAGLSLPSLLAFRAASAAEEFPSRPVTLVVPFASGGSTDVLARILARGMSKNLSRSVIVENQGGAGGTIGTQRVVRAAADGYTLSFGNTGSLAANLALYPGSGFDSRKDFVPVGLGANNPMAIAASPASGIRTLPALLDKLRAAAGTLNFGHAGPGSTSHLASALFLNLTGTQATLVGYRGIGPALTDLTAGTIDAMIDQTLTIIPAHRGGNALALAVATPQRLEQLPDVPTFAEAGVPQFSMAVWNAVMAPAGTPAPVVARLTAALDAALDDPEVRQRLAELAAVAPERAERGPEPLRRLVAAEVDRWATIVREAGIRVE